MLHDDDLGSEGLAGSGRVLLGIGGASSSGDVLDGESLDVESNVVAGIGGLELGVMLLDGLDLGLDSSGGELSEHSWLEDAGLDSSDWDGSDTGDLVDVL